MKIKKQKVYDQFLFRVYLFVQTVNLYFSNFNHFSSDKLYVFGFQWENVSSSSNVNSAMFFQALLKLWTLKRGTHLIEARTGHQRPC